MRTARFYTNFSGEIFAVFGIIIGLVYLYFSFSIKMPRVVDLLGPRFMPLTLGSLFLTISIYLLVHELRRKSESVDSAVPMSMRTVNSIAGTAGLLIFYFLTIEHIGYLLTSLVFVFLFLLLSRFSRPAICAVYTMGIVAIFQLIFRVWLGVPMPTIFQ